MNQNIKYAIALILGLFSFWGNFPQLKGQSSESLNQNQKTLVRQVIIVQDNFQGEKKALVKEYIDQITRWSESSNSPNLNAMPSIPDNLKNVNINVNTIQVKDTHKIIISISDIKFENRNYKRNNPNEIMPDNQGPPPPENMEPPIDRGPMANRYEKRKGKRRMDRLKAENKVVSQSRFNLGFLDVVGKSGSLPMVMPNMDMPELDHAKSLQIGFDHSWGINMIKGKVRFWIGVNYDIQNYRFDNNQVRLIPNSREFGWVTENTQANPDRIADKSKLVTNYLGVPIAIGFQNKKRNPTFSMKFGVQASTLVRSHSKIRLLNGDKEKFFTDFGLNQFAVSPFAILQFKHLGIFAKYGLTDVFRKTHLRQGISNHNLAIGITLSTNIN